LNVLGHPGRAILSGFGRQRRRAEPERERHFQIGPNAVQDLPVARSRTVRLVALGIWLAGGGLWVLLTLMLMLADPAGDVDRGPHTVLFLVSLGVWSLLALPLVKLACRRNQTSGSDTPG
jgi:hypothetical protein